MTDKQVLAAYLDMMRRVESAGYDIYILTLMFNQLAGSPSTIAKTMERETERTYSRLLTRIIKHPARTPIDCMPLLLASADWPVPKKGKLKLFDVATNDGRHIQGIFCVPPINRMKRELIDIVKEEQSAFAGPGKALQRLHIQPVTETSAKAFGYVMKSIERFRLGHEDIIVLPKSHSEMSR